MNEGLWTRCNNCQKILYKQDIIDNLNVLSSVQLPFRLGALERLNQLFDGGQFELIDQDIYPVDFLSFQDQQKYEVRLNDSQKNRPARSHRHQPGEHWADCRS